MITNNKSLYATEKLFLTQNTKNIIDGFHSEKKCFNGPTFQIKVFIFIN